MRLTLCRIFAWCMVGVLFAFLLNNYLNYWPAGRAPLSL